MRVTRRGFLGAASGVAACTRALTWRDLSHPSLSAAPSHSRTVSRSQAAQCVILESDTPLQESVIGFKAALLATRCGAVTCTQASLPDIKPVRFAILPGCLTLERPTVSWLEALLEAGALVLIESGAAFGEPTDFSSHRDLLACRFGVDLRPAVRLWERRGDRLHAHRVPYIEYVWPQPTKIRDFSRVMPLACASAQVVAWSGSLAVAVRRQVGRGTLVFLGSPLGPALLAGDREADGWLRSVLATSA